MEAFDELVIRTGEPERFAPLRDLMLGDHHHDDTKVLEEQLSLTAKDVHAARERLRRANISNGAGFKLIELGLRCSYKRGRRAMSRAYDQPDEAAFHEWRKRVKDLGYQVQILRELWPPVLKRLRSELDRLGDLLGKEQHSDTPGKNRSTSLGLWDETISVILHQKTDSAEASKISVAHVRLTELSQILAV